MVQAPIGYRLRAARKELKRTQAAVAREAGISASYLNLIEANKREIGGALLNRLAAILSLNTDDLTGRTERRMIADLAEAAAEPVVQHLDLPQQEAAELVGRYPAWAQALLTFQRNAREQLAVSGALADRLNQDPVLGESVHELLTHATAIRSASEILDELPAQKTPVQNGRTEEQRTRFREIISVESERLATAAEALRDVFDQSGPAHRALTPADEVDDFLAENDNWFRTLEEAADTLRRTIAGRDPSAGDDAAEPPSDEALIQFARNSLGIHVDMAPPQAEAGPRPKGSVGAVFRNSAQWNENDRTLRFLAGAEPTTRRFQLVRQIAAFACADAIDRVVASPLLTSEEARDRARGAMASYVAGAVLMPYGRFLSAAANQRYDLTTLSQQFAASFEQVCHRLTTLRDPAQRGIPFGFVRSDPAGRITKRFPLPGLALLRHGHACPLWASFTALQTPGRLIRQLAAFPDGSRFLMIAQAIPRAAASFNEAPFAHSVTLICDTLHADRTVYGQGLTGVSAPPATPVGPSCRMCSRTNCRYRGEEAMLDMGAPAA